MYKSWVIKLKTVGSGWYQQGLSLHYFHAIIITFSSIEDVAKYFLCSTLSFDPFTPKDHFSSIQNNE